MDSLYLLIPLSVLLVFVIGLLFWWSVRSGQFDDLEGPAYRMMMDDDKPPSAKGTDDPAGKTPKNGRDAD
ncbi:MAG: cbb3-type cytochrome oxidase assembly protein CcoS [Denitromonas halophila]|jgi:cbb3-type cytochrome oxidase maturation protein|nr:MAG: cbb3-type cytochrome oxidase assembly protein CcoS [Denitromonas halophila]TVT66221.1 MAG: cbb3-type cytochrome oxidase assembly protein CcoS [Denitromonas halophila]TVT75567.1 MAG: cbb3-type cytochrome oxidase assembly protein CcoS [Denitromonas halophila]